MLKVRRKKLGQFFDRYALDALLITNILNTRYLSGFTGSEAGLLLTRDAAWLLCDSRYTTQAESEVSDTEIRQFSDKLESLVELVQELDLNRIGFESSYITVASFNELARSFQGRELVPIGKELDQIRSGKDAAEIELLAEVAQLASAALMAILPWIRPGVSEETVARELEFEMRRQGADGRSFDFIVASGTRGSMPHGRASNKPLAAGEMVTIDFGASRNGYYSDETVTFAVGSPCSRSREIHSVVKEAHDLAIASVRPGIACRDLDAIARDCITRHGYGEFFGHGLGHGIGLEIHEQPVLSPRSNATVEEGMVFTIEPGIYIPGFGGVRLEDTVAVTPDGCRILTGAPKELLVL